MGLREGWGQMGQMGQINVEVSIRTFKTKKSTHTHTHPHTYTPPTHTHTRSTNALTWLCLKERANPAGSSGRTSSTHAQYLTTCLGRVWGCVLRVVLGRAGRVGCGEVWDACAGHMLACNRVDVYVLI